MPWRVPPKTARRVLIFRLGSLGDTVVALPSFHLVARAYPDAERRVLTNVPRDARETDLDAVLGGTGLVHGYMHFDPAERSAAAVAKVRREIRAFGPDLLVYLCEQSSRLRMLRHIAFFMSCGLTTIVGMPEFGAQGMHRHDAATGLWEPEAAFLLRRLAPLGAAAVDDPALWDMRFTAAEAREAESALEGLPAEQGFVAVAPGAKIEVKDWGPEKWSALVAALGQRHPGLGLATIGGPGDRDRAAQLIAGWPGAARDLCGRVSPRVSALILSRARLLVTHDSGPMHLAAAVGTPVAAIFSARAKPGIWFPRGAANRVFYEKLPCFDCGLESCIVERRRCITGIGVEPVLAACDAMLAGERARAVTVA
jgi:heptosyltransferase III